MLGVAARWMILRGVVYCVVSEKECEAKRERAKVHGVIMRRGWVKDSER